MSHPFKRSAKFLASLGPNLVKLGLRSLGASAYHVVSLTRSVVDTTKAGYTNAASPPKAAVVDKGHGWRLQNAINAVFFVPLMRMRKGKKPMATLNQPPAPDESDVHPLFHQK